MSSLSNVNTAVLGHFGQIPLFGFVDNLIAGPASAQVGATRIKSTMTRLTVAGVANGSFILGALSLGGANVPFIVVNDTTAAVKVYCAVGETMNGAANSFLAIPSGQVGIFVPYRDSFDWRAAALS